MARPSAHRLDDQREGEEEEKARRLRKDAEGTREMN